MVHKISAFIISFTLFVSIIGCNDISRKEKFDAEEWKEYIGFDSPDRDLMAEDLLKTHKLNWVISQTNASIIRRAFKLCRYYKDLV